MKIDTNKLKETIKFLDDFYKEDSIKKMAEVEYPKEIKYKSNEWLVYVFYSCLLDYGMKSKMYHQNLIKTYETYPNIFNPKSVMDNYLDNDKLNKIMKESIHHRYPNVCTKKWINLSSELVKYEELISKIKSFSSYLELSNFIRSIKGYGQKTGGLLLRVIYESNICEIDDELTSIPLDRHDIEISYLNVIIDTKNPNSKEIDELSNNYIKYCKELNIKPDYLDKYLWDLGSNYCTKKNCIDCPLKENCQRKK